MRSRPHMTALLATALCAGALGPLPAEPKPSRRQPYPKPGAVEAVPLPSGGAVYKPPMNGSQEVARRLRQVERAAAKRSSMNKSGSL